MIYLLIYAILAALAFALFVCLLRINADENEPDEYPETQDHFAASMARWGYVQVELNK